MWKAILAGVVVAGGVLGWLYWDQRREVPLVVSGFIEAEQVRVGSRVGGRVAAVAVEEGRTLKAGETIFRIDPFDLQDQLRQTQAELAASEAELARLQAGFRSEEIEQARAQRDRATAVVEKLVAGPRPQEIAIAREELNRAKANLQMAETEYARLQKLREEGTAARIEYDEAVRQLKASQAEAAAAQQRVALLEAGTRAEEIAEAKAALAEAEQALKLVEAGFRKEEIARAQAQVEVARARIAAIHTRFSELTVTSPCDCIVEAIDLYAGDLVAPNAPAVALLDPSRLWVRAYVPEDRLGQISLGQKVPVQVNSFPGEKFSGRLRFISREAEFTPRNVQTPEERSKQVFRIEVDVVEGLDRLRAGMGADLLLDEAVTP